MYIYFYHITEADPNKGIVDLMIEADSLPFSTQPYIIADKEPKIDERIPFNKKKRLCVNIEKGFLYYEGRN